MSTNKKCPQCGKVLPVDAPEGMCPACLLAQGMADETKPSVEKIVTLSPDAFTDAELVKAIDEPRGRYTYLGEHGRGGMGRVLLVHDSHLERDIVLKELLPQTSEGATPTPARHSKDMASRFLREAKITGQLEHPSITPVHELGRRADGTLYYTMKFVRGRTLAKAIKEAKSLEERLKLLPHFVDLCNAIAYAHSRGVIHRDIKPSNVMIGDYGETMIIDWGLAKVKGAKGQAVQPDPAQITMLGIRSGDEKSDSGKTQQGQALGTPAYMPPEQASGDLENVDERSDIYSLGAVLFEMLAGVPPFQGESIYEILRKVMAGEVRKISEFAPKADKALVAMVAKAMSVKPQERYQTAKELADAVEEWKPKGVSKVRMVVGGCLLGVLLICTTYVLIENWRWSRAVELETEKIERAGGLLNWKSLAEKGASAGGGALEMSSQAWLVHADALFPSLREAQYVGLFKNTFTEWPKLDDDQARQARELSASYNILLTHAEHLAALPLPTQKETLTAMGVFAGSWRTMRGCSFFYANTLHYMLEINAALALHEEDYETSLKRCEELVSLSNQVGAFPGGPGLNHSTRMLESAIALLEAIPFNSPSLQDRAISIRRRIQESPCVNACKLWPEIMRLEFITMFREYDRASAPGPNPAIGPSEAGQIIVYSVYTSPVFSPVFKYVRRKEELAFLTFWGSVIEVFQKPYYETAEMLPVLNGKKLDELERALWGPHWAKAYPRFKFWHENMTSNIVLAELAKIMIDYKLLSAKEGRIPTDLTELGASYSGGAPIDLFTGKPLIFKSLPNGWQIYSCGPNQRDDGGEKDPKDREKDDIAVLIVE